VRVDVTVLGAICCASGTIRSQKPDTGGSSANWTTDRADSVEFVVQVATSSPANRHVGGSATVGASGQDRAEAGPLPPREHGLRAPESAGAVSATSYVASAAAALTFGELRRPRIGMLTITCSARGRPGRRTLGAEHEADAVAGQSRGRTGRVAPSSRPTTQIPASLAREARGQAADERHRHVLDCAAALGHGRRHVHARWRG